MSEKVFINYRREDDPGFAQFLAYLLRMELGREAVFMDVSGGLKLGHAYRDQLEARIRACETLVVVIGPRWTALLEARAAAGGEDLVVWEIDEAVRLGKVVVPVLVGPNTRMPEGAAPVAAELRKRQSSVLRPESFEADALSMVDRLRGTAGPSARLGRAPSRGDLQSWRLEPLDMTFVRVPEGEFWMGASKDAGSPALDSDAQPHEAPVRRVRISTEFWLGQHPVTNAQYKRFVEACGARPPDGFTKPGFNDPQQPVTHVSWWDAEEFCEWLTTVLDPGWVARLPSEAHWEWAARGADGRRYPWGSGQPDETRAVFEGAGRLARVGGRPRSAGPFGAHDQAGQVWEWCRDVYGPYPNLSTVDVDPCRLSTPADAASRVIRGGSWRNGARDLRATYRLRYDPGARSADLGFRVCVFREPGGRS